MKESFGYWRMSGKVMQMIDQGNVILAEYAAMGLVMTLRMLHYQFVSRQLFANTYRNYKKLSWAMAQGRKMGLVDWDYLEDRVRMLDELPTWDSAEGMLDSAIEWYKHDIWLDQAYAPEFWVEKDALSGVIGPACRKYRVPVLACRGYVSESAQYQASKRFLSYIDSGREPIVFHMGDHDPSGLDMTRDNTESFELMTGEPVKVIRLALNWDQIQHYQPPPNPVKSRDTRTPKYRRQFGNVSYELDALSPKVLNQLTLDAIEPLINKRKWKASIDKETEQRDKLKLVREHFERVIEKLQEDE